MPSVPINSQPEPESSEEELSDSQVSYSSEDDSMDDKPSDSGNTNGGTCITHPLLIISDFHHYISHVSTLKNLDRSLRKTFHVQVPCCVTLRFQDCYVESGIILRY